MAKGLPQIPKNTVNTQILFIIVFDQLSPSITNRSKRKPALCPFLSDAPAAVRAVFAVVRRFLHCKYTIFVSIGCRISRQRLRNGMNLNGNGLRLLYKKRAERKKTGSFPGRQYGLNGPAGWGGVYLYVAHLPTQTALFRGECLPVTPHPPLSSQSALRELCAIRWVWCPPFA